MACVALLADILELVLRRGDGPLEPGDLYRDVVGAEVAPVDAHPLAREDVRRPRDDSRRDADAREDFFPRSGGHYSGSPEAVLDKIDERSHGLALVRPLGRDDDLRARRGREHHDPQDRLPVHARAVALDRDLRLKPAGPLDDRRRRPGVNPEPVPHADGALDHDPPRPAR